MTQQQSTLRELLQIIGAQQVEIVKLKQQVVALQSMTQPDGQTPAADAAS